MSLMNLKNPQDSNEITRAYLDSILVESRYLDAVIPDTSMELYGKRFSSPVMIAAFSHLSPMHEGGMTEMAQGARLSGICNWAGMGSKDELKSILNTGAPTIKIIKPYADRNKLMDMLIFARDAGALAVGIDIDHSFGADGRPDVVVGEKMQPVSSAELREFVQAARIPFIVKGVLSVSDAEKCASAGVNGIMISHHHGILPCAVPPLMALRRIKAALGTDMDLFVDCGIDGGIDTFKCLAMGAKAVCVGRAVLPAFRESGAAGVSAYVEKMNDELRAMMAKTGSKDICSIPDGLLYNMLTGEQY